MTTLVLLAHVGPDAVPLFTSALDAAGIEHVELRAFVENGLSSAYHALAARLRTGGRILPALLKHAGASLPLSGYDAVIYCGWSAAYALMEDVVSVTADRDALAGIVCLDPGYGSAPPAVVDWARLARDGRKLYSAIYTDVPTSGYASSGEFLAQVQREAGAPEGLFTVEHRVFDPVARAAKLHGLTGPARSDADGAFWRGEHVAALHAGPRLLVAGLQALGLDAAPDASSPPSRDAIPPPPPTMPTGTIPPPPPARAMLPTLEEEPRDLRRGDHGPDVGELQVRLNMLGAKLAVDGAFGPATEAAVKDFQRSSWIGADGVVDHATRKELAATYQASKVAPTEPPSDTRATEVYVATGSPDFGAMVLTIAREDLAASVRETGGHNDGIDLRRLYFDPIHLAPGSNWCAAALRSWMVRAAERLGIAMPIDGSAGAQATMAQFKAAGLWITAATARAHPDLIVAGMVPVWDRASAAEPWAGHIGVTSGPVAVVGRVFPTVEGNSGPAADRVIAWSVRLLDDPKLFGFGRFAVS